MKALQSEKSLGPGEGAVPSTATKRCLLYTLGLGTQCRFCTQVNKAKRQARSKVAQGLQTNDRACLSTVPPSGVQRSCKTIGQRKGRTEGGKRLNKQPRSMLYCTLNFCLYLRIFILKVTS